MVSSAPGFTVSASIDGGDGDDISPKASPTRVAPAKPALETSQLDSLIVASLAGYLSSQTLW